LENKTQQNVVMICTAARGGMRSVVDGYIADGLFSRWNIILLTSHIEGSLPLRLATAIKAFCSLIGLILRGRVSLVHCHAAMKGSFWRKSLFAMVSRMAGVPVVFHLHGGVMKAFVARQPFLLQCLIAWILKKQSVVVVLSESWLHYVRSISPRANIEILPNYVSLPQIHDIKGGNDNKAIEVLYLGIISIAKGTFDLLHSFKDAMIYTPALRLTIGGKGEVDSLLALAAELDILDHIIFAGWVSGDEKINLLQRAQIFVLPSYNEGLPVSLLEAMGWQVPVISTRVGGIPELVREGVDGFLMESGDRDALSAAIIKLANNADLRLQMGLSCRDRVVHNFSREVVLPKLEQLYRSLISSNDVIENAKS